MSDSQPTAPLPNEPITPAVIPPTEPFYKRYGLAFAIATLALGIVVLCGLVGAGAFVAGSVLGRTGAAVTQMHPDGGRGGPLTKDIPAPQQEGPRSGERQTKSSIARGTIASIEGNTWTVETRQGSTITVEITSSTAFGVPGSPQAASDFAKGDRVIVVGDLNGNTLTAHHVLGQGQAPTEPTEPTEPPASPGAEIPGT